MEISAASISANSLEQVQGQVQVKMLRKQMDMQEAQMALLLQAIPEPPKAAPGQPGAIVNTFA